MSNLLDDLVVVDLQGGKKHSYNKTDKFKLANAIRKNFYNNVLKGPLSVNVGKVFVFKQGSPVEVSLPKVYKSEDVAKSINLAYTQQQWSAQVVPICNGVNPQVPVQVPVSVVSTAKKVTNIHLIIDRSGSMRSYMGKVNEAVRKLLNENNDGVTDVNVRITTFDNYVEVGNNLTIANQINSFRDIVSRGSTNLNGAVVESLTASFKDPKADLTSIFIITDGGHNSGVYSYEQAAEAVKEAKSLGYTINMLGAYGVETKDYAQRIGLESKEVAEYSMSKVENTLAVNSGLFRDMRHSMSRGIVASNTYTEAHKKSLT